MSKMSTSLILNEQGFSKKPLFIYPIFWILQLRLTVAGEIKALAGCDLLTISPKLLEELDNSNEPVKEMLSEKIGKLRKLVRQHWYSCTFWKDW